MPFILKKDKVLSNPVMGTFIESFIPFFDKVIVFGFESCRGDESVTYPLDLAENVKFISLGPEGQFWDYFAKMRRLKYTINQHVDRMQVLLLRVPSHLAYFIWKYSGKPEKTALLFIGNPFFTAAYSNVKKIMYLFRVYRSFRHDRRMKVIARKPSSLVFANSEGLVKLWGKKLNRSVSLVHTSSLSKMDINLDVKKLMPVHSPYRLLFVGRICFDKGIRELLEALYLLNFSKKNQFLLDLVGPIGNIGNYTINQLIDKYHVHDFVNIVGVVPFGSNLYSYYLKAEFYILPSYHEGMPKTVWEAMSQGTPVIATEIDGMKDFFKHEKDIYFVKPKCPASIKNAIEKLVVSPELAENLRYNGLNRARLVTREAQADKIIKTFRLHWKKDL